MHSTTPLARADLDPPVGRLGLGRYALRCASLRRVHNSTVPVSAGRREATSVACSPGHAVRARRLSSASAATVATDAGAAGYLSELERVRSQLRGLSSPRPARRTTPLSPTEKATHGSAKDPVTAHVRLPFSSQLPQHGLCNTLQGRCAPPPPPPP